MRTDRQDRGAPGTPSQLCPCWGGCRGLSMSGTRHSGDSRGAATDQTRQEGAELGSSPRVGRDRHCSNPFCPSGSSE